MDDFNPYAAPEAGVFQSPLATAADEGRGVWRDGKILVMAKVARLPSRCLKCNEPATTRLKRTLAWHSQWIYVLVLVSPLIYIIVALIVRKTAKVELPLCDQHRASRVRNILIGWVVALSGIGLCFGPTYAPDPVAGFLVLAGLITFLFGLIFGVVGARTVLPQKIDDTHVWLKKVSPLYLAELPILPGSEGYEVKPMPKMSVDEH